MSKRKPFKTEITILHNAIIFIISIFFSTGFHISLQASVEAGDSHDSEGVVMNKSDSNPNMKENMLVVVSDFEAEAGAPFIDDKVTAGNWAKGYNR